MNTHPTIQPTSDYEAFLESKLIVDAPSGFAVDPSSINPSAFPFQAAVARWACNRGRSAIFAGTGLGKTIMELEVAAKIHAHTGGDVLIFTPPAVASQMEKDEAPKHGYSITRCKNQADVRPGINVTNYQRHHLFDPRKFAGVILDESSILKGLDGKHRIALTENWRIVPHRHAATATPAPNDIVEIGNHAEFLGVMSRAEMLATFFTHDGGSTTDWTLKKHGEKAFYRWLASWCVYFQHPRDIGFDDERFTLPELRFHEHVIPMDDEPADGELFPREASTLSERRQARKNSLDQRVEIAAAIAKEHDGSVLLWCDLNAESAALAKTIPGAIEVKGSDSDDHKESALAGFASGEIEDLVTKPSIAGFGMNFQRCRKMVFTGLSDSWEQFYQGVRRCWRFGQTQPVDVHIVIHGAEGAVLANIKSKEAAAQKTMSAMAEQMKEFQSENILSLARDSMTYSTEKATGEGWELLLSDCVEAWRAQPDNSLDMAIFSPPFASLYTYTNSDRDMGNCRDHREFARHFRFLVRELFRTIKPGRIVAFHCMDLPTSKVRDGYIGLRDFRGMLVRIFERAGFILHSQTTIRKDPVTQMQRTKALGLLHKTVRGNASMSRVGIPDYLIAVRKPGEANPRVTHGAEYPVSKWQQVAEPIWMDINPNDTLQYRSARDNEDERHICPLQLTVIRRAIELWTNPSDLVASPFAGIGSEGFVALELGRRFFGTELKRSYFECAKKNLLSVSDSAQLSIFDLAECGQEEGEA